jgi:hypothetical protein
MNIIDQKLSKSFNNELDNYGALWRLLSRETIVDLIILKFIYFQKNGESEEVIEIINYSIKAILLSKIAPINSKQNINTVNSECQKGLGEIKKAYDEILEGLGPILKRYINAEMYDLNEAINYLRNIVNLKSSSLNENIFYNILGISYIVLSKKMFN